MMLWQFLCIYFGYKSKQEVEAMHNTNSAMVMVNGQYARSIEWMLVPGDEVTVSKRFE